MGTSPFLSRLRAFFQTGKGGDVAGKKVIYFTRFVPTWDAGGGCRRMMQMRDVFDEVDHEYDMISALRQDRLNQEAIQRVRRHGLQVDDGSMVCEIGNIASTCAACIRLPMSGAAA